MSVQRVLVVDDEESILKVVDYALTQEGFEVRTAPDAEGAEFLLSQIPVDLVILDVMLPSKSGLEIARDLRAHSNVPIIMLSARTDEVDRILGLEFGADDYVTKPFSPRELVSRVKAILRRTGAPVDEKQVISVGDLHIDTLSTSRVPSTASSCTWRDTPAPLSPARRSSRRCGRSRRWATSGPSTCTSTTCARRSRSTRRIPPICSRCAGSAIASASPRCLPAGRGRRFGCSSRP
jgi:CheY-like chemotaxis protein